MSVLTDDRLVRRAVGGDERAFAAIFDRYHQRLYRYCLAIVGRPEDAQDALQNTMVKVLRALPGEERRIELKPWLYRIAHNESIELLRRRREGRELDAELEASGSSLAEEVAMRERLGQLLSDLDALPERQRGALVMRELAGLGFAEIGTALGTSAAVARQTLYEARLGLRQMDEGREMGCAAVTRTLSDGDGRVVRRRDIRAHLRACSECRRFHEEIEGRRRDLASLAPLPAAAAAGLLQGLLGGGGAGGGGAAAALGGGAVKTLGGSALLKGAATVAVVAAVGVGAAERGGLVDLGAGDKGEPAPAKQSSPAGSGSSGAQPAAGGTAAADVDGASSVAPGGSGVGVRGARTADPKATGGASPGGEESAPAAMPVNATGPTGHPRGKGHEKRHPEAAAHGQQTAGEHKAAGKGGGRGKGVAPGSGGAQGKGASSGKGNGTGKGSGTGKATGAGKGAAPPKKSAPPPPASAPDPGGGQGAGPPDTTPPAAPQQPAAVPQQAGGAAPQETGKKAAD
ncbi:MAG TPA: sigma-70 family RNA polymerase sigma factor [Solirubrobacterales bacterium]|nr:sigma-70 family RNA polymerase sigma factor [Solirubrobacterales bacterium]